jgi:non-heme chloroperoxidase
VADALGVITALGLHRPVVVGSSLSGTVVTRLVLQAPDVVAGAVVVGGPGHWGATDPAPRAAYRDLTARLAADRATAVAGWVPGWFGPAVGPETHRWTTAQILDSGPYIDALFDEVVEVDDRAVLPTARRPIAFLHGELDPIPLAIAAESAALVPGGTLTVLDGVAHMPHLESPSAFEAAVRVGVEGW